MDNVKDAFQRVKKDINNLKSEMGDLRVNSKKNREKMIEICTILKQITGNLNKLFSTNKQQNQTFSISSSTYNSPSEGLKMQNLPISTGNQGVSTDRQTDTSTDRQTQKTLKNEENSFQDALEVLESLDNIKKEIRLKFKRLTEQELLVFSTIYQLTDEVGYANYKILAQKLNLTESSVRDYVLRLIEKGIPVEKMKIKNKKIQLIIPQDFKKIANLSTILQLRDL